MENIFIKYPEFVDSDVRTNRFPTNKFDPGYNINPTLQYIRHSLALPKSLVKGKRVLDLGCCIGGTGAWVLSAGASKYVGVELQTNFCQLACTNLSKYFSKTQWEIKETSFTDFFLTNCEKFDIVVAWGVLYHSIDYVETLNAFASVATEKIIIDSISPILIHNLFENHQIDTNSLDKIPYVEYPVSKSIMVFEGGNNLLTNTALPNIPTIEYLLSLQGFKLDTNLTTDIRKLLPLDYGHRFLVTFSPSGSIRDPLDFESVYTGKSKQEFIDFNKPTEWEFNSVVAEHFVDHAQKHIPKYNEVIEQSIDICGKLIKDPAEDRIIDVGCATGETIKRLFGADFHNLVGVDSSRAMLAKVQDLPIAHWIHSDKFPEGEYHAVLCNWTLHFMREKLDYITSIYNGLHVGGFLILTDKTKNSGIDLELYYDFKRKQGVSEEEIHAKAESLKDVMFIDSPEWYLDTLRNVGFKEVSIINSAPCFTTFLAIKN